MKMCLTRILLGTLPLSMFALAACVDEPTSAPVVADGAGLEKLGWELAPAPAGDAAWTSTDGRRYSALFVAGDGTAYGRFADAREMAPPTDADHGAFDP